MRKLRAFIVLASLTTISLSFFSLTFADDVLSDPSRIGFGARPTGLGKAFVGLADDGSAIFYNPAGLGKFKSSKFTGMVGIFKEDVTYYTVGLAAPSSIGSLGIGYVGMVSPFAPAVTLTGMASPDFSGNYDNYNAGIGYVSWGKEFVKGLSLGLSAKIFLQEYKDSAGVSDPARGTGVNLDYGILIDPFPWGSIGFTAVNGLSFGSGGKFIWLPNAFHADNVEEKLPLLYRAGGSLRVLGDNGIADIWGQKVSLALDTEMDPENPRPNVWYGGAEWMPSPNIAFRAGVDQVLISGDAGFETQNNFTAGVGFVFSGFTIDYAYHQYGESSDNITHYISIGYIGEEVKEKKPAPQQRETEEAKPSPAPTPEAAAEPGPPVEPKPVIKTFYDVPAGYRAKDAIESLATLGILGGYPDGSFRPNSPLTRAEFATILVRARGVEPLEVAKSPFPDVPAYNWAAKYVKEASALKLFFGYPDGTFKPAKNISRAEGVVVITKFSEVPIPAKGALRAFPDLPSNHWASPYVWAARERGMLDYISGNFEPGKPMTRAEVAEILSKTPWGKERIQSLQR